MQALAVDIGGTKILAGLVTGSGATSAVIEVPTPAQEGGTAIVAAVVRAAREVLAQATGPIAGCGVGTAGIVGADGGIASATDLLRDWAGTPLRDQLTAELGISVRVLNDVHAAGLCEAVLGAAKGHSSALVIAVGTGVGAALVRDGRVITGAHGIAGALGHMAAPLRQGRICSCGRRDHVEAYASGPSMETEYSRRTGEKFSLRDIVARAAAGDATSAAVLEEGASALGCVIGGANNLLDTEIIVIGGGVAGIGEAFLAPLRAAAQTEALGATGSAKIVTARFGANACLVGAGLLVLS